MEYAVEKILRRRMNKGKVEYRVKWQNYPSSQNTWVSQENTQNCAEMVEEFENLCLKNIIGVKKNVAGQIYYAIEWKDGFEPEFKRNDIVKQRWPLQLAAYLESIIVFRVIDQASTVAVQETDVSGLAETPNRILKCSDTAGELLYWCEWGYRQRRFVSSKTAKEQFAQLVIDYLEMNLQ